MDSPTWNCLPTEMRVAIVDLLEFDDVKAFSKVNLDAYYLSIPVIFKVCFYLFICLQNAHHTSAR